MQEPGRRPFAGVDLRRPKGYPAAEVRGEPCPRCESRDTKFCYYNNYNTSQPRHYCRSCRRYWTKGGSLRNVPVGGGSRKGNSSSSSSTSAAASANNSKRRRVAPSEPKPGTAGAPAAAEKEAIPGTIACPVTDVEAAANGTVGDPATAVDAARATAKGTVHDPATAMDAARTEATDDPGAPPAVDEVGFADPSVALGLAVAGAGGEDPCDASAFEWPSGCDLGTYWAPGVLADADPALFLNLP